MQIQLVKQARNVLLQPRGGISANEFAKLHACSLENWSLMAPVSEWHKEDLEGVMGRNRGEPKTRSDDGGMDDNPSTENLQVLYSTGLPQRKFNAG